MDEGEERRMLRRSEKEREKRRNEMKEELCEGLNLGLQITYHGDIVEFEEINDVLILMEECDYMREFVADDQGKIIQINYDPIKL